MKEPGPSSNPKFMSFRGPCVFPTALAAASLSNVKNTVG